MSRISESNDRLNQCVACLSARQGLDWQDGQVLLTVCLSLGFAGLGPEAFLELSELAHEYVTEVVPEGPEQPLEMFYRGFVLGRFVQLGESKLEVSIPWVN